MKMRRWAAVVGLFCLAACGSAATPMDGGFDGGFDAGSVVVTVDAGPSSDAGRPICPVGDGGQNPNCCQPTGNFCANNLDCCSGDCFISTTQPGICCTPGMCP